MSGPVLELAETGRLPDGTEVRILRHRAVRSAAHLMGVSAREAEIAALEQEIIPERYLRNFKTLGFTDQARFLRTRVALVGLGGLGGPLLEGLVRLGFGVIKACDHDIFEPSNLNRQLLATESELGASKAGAARARMGEINPSVEFGVEKAFIEPGGFAAYFAGSDMAIDALGGMACRPAAEEGAREAGVPLITAAVAGWTVMAATVLPGDTGPASLFCSGAQTGEASAEDVLGCLTPAINVAAGLVLAEAVRLALGRPPLFGGPGGSMAVMDLERASFERFTLPPHEGRGP